METISNILKYKYSKSYLLSNFVLSILVSVVSHYFFIKQIATHGADVSIMSIVYFIGLIITVLFIYKQAFPILKSKNVAEYYDHHD